MKFDEEQIEFMKKIGIDVDFDNLSDDDFVFIEENVANEYEIRGLDQDYNPTETGKMCESILDILNE